jgi:hypothetical protein
VRRLLVVLIGVMLVAGCGDGGTTTVTTTETGQTDTGATDTGATEQEPPPQDRSGERIEIGDFFAFETPSGRIGCAATTDPTTLRCDTAFPTSFSKSDRKCEFGDYGQAFLIEPEGEANAICAGDTVLSANDSRTIGYGQTWLLGPYRCVSRKSGLTCENGEGHGVELSLESQRVF